MEATPIACDLSLTEGARQALEWRDLQRRASSVEPIEGGVAIEYAAELRPRVEDLARREAGCCAFLEFRLSDLGDGVRLTITSEHADAVPVIELLTGADT